MASPSLQHKQFLYHLFLCKEEFTNEYRKLYKDSKMIKDLFLWLLNELKEAICDGNCDSLMKLYNNLIYLGEVENLNLLKEFYSDIGNPIRNSNFVILACKYNRLDILEFLFDNNNILNFMSTLAEKKHIEIEDMDENCHNAFYYALRSSNVGLIELLIAKWPNNYFAIHLNELENVLSKAYEELKLRNILMSSETQICVESKLLNIRFYSNKSDERQTENMFSYNTIERVHLVLENISLLKTEYLNKEVDGQFLYLAKFVAQNIHILKRRLRSTYDSLPWEEIEFCLVTFVSSQAKEQEINLFNHALLKKEKMLAFLGSFAEELKDIIKDEEIVNKTDLPIIRREQIIAAITHKNPDFKDLYDVYMELRDIHSLQKIKDYTKLALVVNPEEREGQLIIIRAIQVIGEYLKNTLESPKLSKSISELLLISLPKNTREIMIELRNSLSHVYSLEKRTEIEENEHEIFFKGIQNDTKKIGDIIDRFLKNTKMKIINKLLVQIFESESLHEMKELVKDMKQLKLSQYIPVNFKMVEYEKLQDLCTKLESCLPDKKNNEINTFLKINQTLNALIKNPDSDMNYYLGFAALVSFGHVINDDEIDNFFIQGMKIRASKVLHDINTSTRSNPDTLKQITDLLGGILPDIKLRIEGNKLDEVYSLIWEIFYIIEIETGNIKWVEELRNKIRERCILSTPSFKQSRLTKEKYEKQLKLKLAELKSVLNKNMLSDNLAHNFSLYKEDMKLQALVEMLLLDIMSILGSSNKYLENNLLLLDDNTPLLIGKYLRNHLAHYNELVDLLLSDPSVAVILNASKLSSENITESNKKIGKLITDNPIKLKVKFNQELDIIINQEKMFVFIEEGNFEGFNSCLDKGADINARNYKHWTSVHFAAKGPNFEIFKFIVKQKDNINVKDLNAQSPLHIAALNGRKNIVEFMIKRPEFSVNDVDGCGMTPLHLAARNGHKHTVIVLLQNKANTFATDLAGFLPVYYAIRNNHVDVTETLLGSINVDAYECAGGFTPLHEAAEGGRLEIVNLLLNRGANVNAKNDRNWTPLHAAARNGYSDVLKALILSGAGVNTKIVTGLTALHCAAESGYDEIINILIENGSSIDALDKMKRTPLYCAVLHGHEKIVNALLNCKASVIAADIEGKTVLHIAAQAGHYKIMLSLLTLNIDVNVKDKNGSIPLHYAAKHGHKSIVDLLLKSKTSVNVTDKKDLSPLHEAAFKGHTEIVNLLLENKAEVNMRTKDNITPLHKAVISNTVDLIELLIKYKADVNAKSTKEDFTPLHLAAMNGFGNVTVCLLKNMADVNSKDGARMTPLHYAAYFGHINIIDHLIKYNAEINIKNIEDYTPLHAATEKGHYNIVKTLLQNNSNASIKAKGVTPLKLAVKHNYVEIVRILVENQKDLTTTDTIDCFQLAVILGFLDIVKIFLKYKIDINVYDRERNTPLHKAASVGHKNIVYELINGSNIDAINCNKETPLFIASRSGYVEVVDILKKEGASIKCINDEGSTPLHAAAAKGHLDVVNLLLVGNEENLNVRDFENRTPLELSVSYGHIEVVKVLLDYNIIDINDKGANGYTVLHIAAQENRLEIAKYLLDKGSNIHAKNTPGSKPIHIAAREGNLSIVKFFLSKGCTVEDPGSTNQTLLHYAAMKDNLHIVKYLIEQGANTNAKDTQMLSPIHIAAAFGHRDIINELLKNDAVYNTVDKMNRTPLSMTRSEAVRNLLESTEKLFEAVQLNRLSEVERCIKIGAFIDVKNSKGETPLHYAAWKGYIEVVNLLLKNKACVNVGDKKGCTPLHYASKYSHLKVTKALLAYGGKYNVFSESGKTPLDVTNDENIKQLFILVDDSFKYVENGNFSIVTKLNKIKDIDTIKAVMNAHNIDNRSLIHAASYYDFEKIEDLKEIFQNDASLKIDKALAMLNENNDNEALHIFRKILEKRKEIFGEHNLATLDIQTYIAKILYKQGLYSQSLKEFEDIFKRQKELFGFKDRITLSTQSYIAFMWHMQGENNKALDIFQEVFSWQKRLLGCDHTDTLETQLHMALVLDKLEKCEDALKANQEVYLKRKKSNHPAALLAQNNIAMVLSHQQKYKDALKIFKEVLERKIKLFGMTSPDTIRTMHNIAGVLSNLEKYSEALKSYECVLKTRKMVLGPNHPDTLITQYEMGTVLFTQSKYNSALRVHEEVLERRKTVFSHWHPSVLESEQMIQKIKSALEIEGNVDYNSIGNLSNCQEKKIYGAASMGDIGSIENFLKSGGDINIKDSDGRTLLHYATSNGQNIVVSTLVKNGADVNIVTDKGNTPLHTAAIKGYKDIVAILLEDAIHNDLNNFINAQTFVGGTTALHIAAKNGLLDIVLSLLNHGAVYNIQNKEGKAPINVSTNQNIKSILQLVDETFKDAKMGNEGLINRLQDVKQHEFTAVTKASNEKQETLLQILVSNKEVNVNIVELLLKLGANIDVKDAEGRNLLIYAINNGKFQIVELLLKNGADINVITKKGNTPLHAATCKGDKQMLEILLKYANSKELNNLVNVQTFVGKSTALHVATERGFFDIVLCLLNHGAVYNLQNKEGKMPFDLSKDQNITDLLKLIKESFEDARKGNELLIPKLKALTQQDFSAVTRVRDENQKTLLQVILMNKRKNISKKLLKMLKQK